MFRLFPCIPILWVFFIKKCKKKCVCVVGLKIASLLVKNVYFGVKKGIGEILALGSCKNVLLFSI